MGVCCSVTVRCDRCSSVVVSANRRLHLDAIIHDTRYNAADLTYHWELFMVAGASSDIPRCMYSQYLLLLLLLFHLLLN